MFRNYKGVNISFEEAKCTSVDSILKAQSLYKWMDKNIM